MPLLAAPTTLNQMKKKRTVRLVGANGKSYNVLLIAVSPLQYMYKHFKQTDTNRTVTSPTVATTSNKTANAIHIR